MAILRLYILEPMNSHLLKESLWNQFGAGIDMFANTVKAWPESNWHPDSKPYYLTYHTALFLDYYLTVPPTTYKPQLPYRMVPWEEIPPAGIDDLLPERLYTKDELLGFIESARSKCKNLIGSLDDKLAGAVWIETPDDIAGAVTLNYTVLEILLYNLRHLQHHTGQLNLLLGEQTGFATDWVAGV